MKLDVQCEIESLERARREFCNHKFKKALSAWHPAATPDELAVVELLAERLASGRRAYGSLDVDNDDRNFLAEAIEEIVNALVYLSARLVKLRRKNLPLGS